MKKLFTFIFALLTTLTSCKMFGTSTNPKENTTSEVSDDFNERGFDPFDEDRGSSNNKEDLGDDYDDEISPSEPRNPYKKYYVIKFVDAQGNRIEEKYVEEGKVPEVPREERNPEKASDQFYKYYVFSGWNPVPYPATRDQTYEPMFSEKQLTYNVKFYSEGTLLSSTDYYYGASVTKPANPTKEPTESKVFSFAGWNTIDKQTSGTNTIPQVKDNEIYYAAFTSATRKYSVKFFADDGINVLYHDNIDYGSTPKYPYSTPEKRGADYESYSFAGWQPSITAVTGDQTYIATFAATGITYKITFVDDENNVIETLTVPQNAMPWPETPKIQTTHYTYDFVRWDPVLAPATKDTTYKGVFTKSDRKYTITYVNGVTHEVINTETLSYGATPTPPTYGLYAPPTHTLNYKYNGWEPAISTVTDDIEYVSTYLESLRYYRIEFREWDDSLYEEYYVEYGVRAVYKGKKLTKTEVKYNDVKKKWQSLYYECTGWIPNYDFGIWFLNRQVGPATMDAIYYPNYYCFEVTDIKK